MKVVKQLWNLLYKARYVLAALITCLSFWGIYSLYDIYSQSDPKLRIGRFFQLLKSGRLNEAKKYLGSTTCACNIPGGWMSYLVYKSGQEPNLAYLTKSQFSIDSIDVVGNIKDHKINFKDDKTQRAIVAITFPEGSKPLFLPLKMAYGSSMTEKEFKDFLTYPNVDWKKGFSLRLRSSLKKGFIDVPKDVKLHHDAVFELTNSEDLIRLLGNNVATFLSPKDPGIVLKPNGARLEDNDVLKSLPRLQKITMNLLLVRKSPSPVWLISRCDYAKPILETGTEVIVLDDFESKEKKIANKF